MRKTRLYTIYRYRKTRRTCLPAGREKNISKEYIYLPLPLTILFFVFAVLLFIFFTSSSSHSNKIEHLAYSPLQVFHKQIKAARNSPAKFPLLSTLLSTKSVSLSPTASPHKFVQIVSAQEQNKAANDYCLNVPVLYYHHTQPLSVAKQLGHAQLTVDSNFFDTQMAYLNANNYHAVSAEELANALTEHRSLSAKSIVVTIDDGYDDNYNYAFQILKKYNITGNFMIPTGLIGNNGYMTWGELKEIAGNPLMHIYNHTWSHSALGSQTKEKIEYEINTAQSQLESNLGKASKILTYPYGSFSPLVIDILKKEGFTAAFSTIGGTMQCDSYIFTLHRIHIGNAPLTVYGL